MNTFDIKLIPKDKADISRFINFKTAKIGLSLGLSLKDYRGEIVYSNLENPGKHIYIKHIMF